MDPKLWGTIILVLGILLVIAQVVFSWRASKAAQKAKTKVDAGAEGFGTAIVDILKELSKSIPLGVAGILLILIGAAIGGLFSPADWFPSPTGSTT